MATQKKVKKQTFEEAVSELEATVARLDSDEITLDESLALFARGVELTGACKKILNDIEGRIVKLVENVNKVDVVAGVEGGNTAGGDDAAGNAAGAGIITEEAFR